MISLPVAAGLARNWWLLLIRGILGVLFGLVAFAWPALTLVTLVLVYGAYAFVDGLTAIWVGVGQPASLVRCQYQTTAESRSSSGVHRQNSSRS